MDWLGEVGTIDAVFVSCQRDVASLPLCCLGEHSPQKAKVTLCQTKTTYVLVAVVFHHKKGTQFLEYNSILFLLKEHIYFLVTAKNTQYIF